MAEPEVMTLGECGCDCWQRVSHTIRFVKEWYGYIPFDFTGSSIIDRLYLKFTLHIEEDFGVSGIFLFDGYVEFNQLNGWVTKAYTATLDGVPLPDLGTGFDFEDYWANNDAMNTHAELLPTGSTPRAWTTVSSTFLEYVSGSTTIQWTLSNPYTIEQLEADVDALAAMFNEHQPFDPNAPGSPLADNSTVVVRYNQVGMAMCDVSFFDPGSFPQPFENCRVPFFGPIGELHYFPSTLFTFDAIYPPELPVIVTDGPTPGIEDPINNLDVGGTDWTNGSWVKSRTLHIYSPEPPDLCVERSVSSSEEVVADVCFVPGETADIVDPVTYVLLNIPPGRVADTLTFGDFWTVTDVLFENSNLTAGGCPCTV